ncbi:hypothetical protein K402DRAFT_405765 [Aulographum hederae CBS 113979]|uniref:RNase H type-1 domain-containing protein n=1 Tax=Aulographum hederae CBS 113979 TaxID=1176131 RepID=A0A6G1GV58_9PEZI|nr:hypothetical protein K402DRAFT_405765 [Aulographum hederae CBS 113979]
MAPPLLYHSHSHAPCDRLHGPGSWRRDRRYVPTGLALSNANSNADTRATLKRGVDGFVEVACPYVPGCEECRAGVTHEGTLVVGVEGGGSDGSDGEEEGGVAIGVFVGDGGTAGRWNVSARSDARGRGDAVLDATLYTLQSARLIDDAEGLGLTQLVIKTSSNHLYDCMTSNHPTSHDRTYHPVQDLTKETSALRTLEREVLRLNAEGVEVLFWLDEANVDAKKLAERALRFRDCWNVEFRATHFGRGVGREREYGRAERFLLMDVDIKSESDSNADEESMFLNDEMQIRGIHVRNLHEWVSQEAANVVTQRSRRLKIKSRAKSTTKTKTKMKRSNLKPLRRRCGMCRRLFFRKGAFFGHLRACQEAYYEIDSEVKEEDSAEDDESATC